MFSESPSTPSYSNRRNKSNRNGFKPNTYKQGQESSHQQQHQPQQQQQQQSSSNDSGYTRRFKPKIQPTSPEPEVQPSSSLYKFKLNRAPGRWQYKTSPKPRVTIRKQNGEEVQPQVQAVTPSYDAAAGAGQQESQHADSQGGVTPADSRSDDIDLDSSSSVNGDVLNDDETLDNIIENKKLPIETLKVEISTPADFKDTYYEIATIKSPYTFQVSLTICNVAIKNISKLF